MTGKLPISKKRLLTFRSAAGPRHSNNLIDDGTTLYILHFQLNNHMAQLTVDMLESWLCEPANFLLGSVDYFDFAKYIFSLLFL